MMKHVFDKFNLKKNIYGNKFRRRIYATENIET